MSAPQQSRATAPRNGPGGAPLWLWWTVGIVLLVALAVLVWRLSAATGAADAGEPATPDATTIGDDGGDGDDDTAGPTAPGAGPTDAATTGPPASTMPLKGPEESRLVDGVSAAPTTPELPDGDYFAHLTGIDVAARTVTFDVEIMYVGPAAIDYLAAHDPTAENPPPNDYVIVNSSSATRTLPLAAGVRIWDWCYGPESLGVEERTLEEWAAAPAGGDTTCGLGAALSHGWNEVYWFDVRDGVVQQVVGQYLP